MGQPREVSTAAAKIPGLHLTLPGWVTYPFLSQPLGGGLGEEASIGHVQVGGRALEADNEVSFTESMGSVSWVTPQRKAGLCPQRKGHWSPSRQKEQASVTRGASSGA